MVLKLKGVKRNFNQEPIDYKKIRREDIHRPKGAFFKQKEVSNFKIFNTLITQIKQPEKASTLLIFIHGGAFISGPAKHHWDSIKEIAKRTNHTIWMCDYPKTPEHKISEISKNIDSVFDTAIEKYTANQITLVGDSVGATLITALTQRLIQKKRDLPKLIILISPVMDATMSNSEIDDFEHRDPMLSKIGVLSSKKMCAENGNLKDLMISPLFGSFDNFPKTILFLAENDITYPDQLLAVRKLNEAEIDIEVIRGEKMPHIWPLLPVMKEAKTALKEMIHRL